MIPKKMPKVITKYNFLSVKQVAEVLNNSVGSVYGLVRSGQLPAYRYSERKIMIREQDLYEFIEKAKGKGKKGPQQNCSRWGRWRNCHR